MTESRDDIIDKLLKELPVFAVACLWTLLAVMTEQSYIGLVGLAILYRRYTKKTKIDADKAETW